MESSSVAVRYVRLVFLMLLKQMDESGGERLLKAFRLVQEASDP